MKKNAWFPCHYGCTMWVSQMYFELNRHFIMLNSPNLIFWIQPLKSDARAQILRCFFGKPGLLRHCNTWKYPKTQIYQTHKVLSSCSSCLFSDGSGTNSQHQQFLNYRDVMHLKKKFLEHTDTDKSRGLLLEKVKIFGCQDIWY